MVKALELENISFTYRGRTKAAIKDINLSVPRERVILVIGRSGSGKTSLIRSINGLIPHFYPGNFSGKIYFLDEDITTLNASERFKLGISTVMQFPEDQLLSRKVWRSVAFGLANLGFPREKIMRKVKWALKLVEMEDYFDREVNSLSAGQKQKVALASALAIEPKILLLDEPTSQLDPLSAKKFFEVLKSITKELNLTVIISEHRTDELFDYIDQVIVLEKGKLFKMGSRYEIFYNGTLEKLGLKVPTIVKLAKKVGLLHEKINLDKLTEVLRSKLILTDSKFPESDEVDKKRDPLIIVRKLYYSYDNKRWILDDISLNVFRGELLVIMGPNGAGKTTLAKLLTGLLRTNRGQIYYPEKKMTNPTFKQLIGYVAYAPQNPEDLIFNTTVYDEIAFSLRLKGVRKEILDAKVREIAKKFNLEDVLFNSPYSISGGEKLRTILASIYALNAKIYILDEPTRGLDWRLKIELMELLSGLKREGRSIILITHDTELVSNINVDRVVILNNGKVWLEGDRRDVLTSEKLLEANLLRPVISEIFSSIGYSKVSNLNEAVKILKLRLGSE